jgi:hypothetical protein
MNEASLMRALKPLISQSIIVETLKINPTFPPFAKGRNYPFLEKRGEGRFSEEHVFSIMDSLVTQLQ